VRINLKTGWGGKYKQGNMIMSVSRFKRGNRRASLYDTTKKKGFGKGFENFYRKKWIDKKM